MDKTVGISEQSLSELVEQVSQWMATAQTLAYLIGGVNGAGADETLRLARAKLGKLFETLEHDAVCWREIANRPDASDYICAFASGRADALQEWVDRAYERFEQRTEGR